MRSPFLRRFGMPSPFFDNETGFSPAALFALSEPGIWLDPSDVANLDWRRNLLTYTEQFDNAAWTKSASTITADATTAPDGTMTADKVVETATTAAHGINPATFTFAASTAYTASMYIKAAERTFAYMQFASAAFVPSTRAVFNLSDGTASQVQNSTATITSIGDGWYRCTLSATSVAGGVSTTPVVVAATISGGPSSYAGDGTSGVFMWGAQLELGSVATDYQKITDVNTEVLQRFPTTTMFVDRIGTTPVTTPGQEVGLRLDKSKGLVLGPELGSGAALDKRAATDGTVTRSGGVITFVSAASGLSTAVSQEITGLVVGNTYRFSGRMRRTSGAIGVFPSIRTASGGGGSTLATGPIIGADWTNFSFFWQATQTSAFFSYVAGNNQSIEVVEASHSVKELAGNHAQATDDLTRGIYGIEPLGGRRNLLTFTEQFDNAAWLKTRSSISANVASAPDGTNTADKIVEDTSTNSHFIAQSVSVAANASMAISIYAKPSGRDFLAIATQDQAGTFRTSYFNLSSGTVGTVAAGQTASILSSGDGWYRCTVVQSQSATSGTFTFYPSPAAVNGSASYTGDGTSGILVWGAQLELGTSATAYQRVVDQYNVTQAGVPTLHYVQYDGSDDFYVTPTITPGTDKVQVFAGARKLSDAAAQDLVTFGFALAGSFVVMTPRTSGVNSISWRAGGSTIGLLDHGVVAPATFVTTGLSDIPADVLTLRYNGAQVAQSTADQGTGNFLAYPLYIGRRGGTSLSFSGRDYGIIVRFGANLTATQIADTEVWMNQRTGAY